MPAAYHSPPDCFQNFIQILWGGFLKDKMTCIICTVAWDDMEMKVINGLTGNFIAVVQNVASCRLCIGYNLTCKGMDCLHA